MNGAKLTTDWVKIHLLEEREKWWAGKLSTRKRELIKWQLTGQRAHYWYDKHLHEGNKAAAAANLKQIEAIRPEIIKWKALVDEAEVEIHRLRVAINKLKPKGQWWPMGGWVRPGEPNRMQRIDQGQDFEIPRFHSVVAPGSGHCTGYAADRAFPNGFGNPYAIVSITSGRFAGHQWYLGHANEPIIRPGQSFSAGHPLARLPNSLNSGWGWIEIGLWEGGPGPMGTGSRFHSLFAPLWRS